MKSDGMDVGVFTYDTPNLGDEMQAFAALAHLGRVGTFVDRDRMADFPGRRKTRCVFNAWFGRGGDFRRPSSQLQPIWHGFTAREELFDSPWLPYLIENGPIGCRDVLTTELLCERGVDAYWSGCLTLFLGDALHLPPREREGVLFVDVPPVAEAFIPADIVARAIRLSTFPPPSILHKPLERWATVARIVERLASAELVVTRRLHVALPAASFGTPVVAIPDAAISFAKRRFSGVEDIVSTVFLEHAPSRLPQMDWRSVPAPCVPSRLKERYAAFRALLTSEGLADPGLLGTPLDDAARSVQRVRNTEGIRRPGRLMLRLDDRVFELDVRLWSDDYIDVALSGFYGLSKLAFDVYVCPANSDSWIRCGALRDLVMDENPEPVTVASGDRGRGR